MKPSRTVVAARDEGWAALEALVLAELDSLQPAPRAAVGERAPAPQPAATPRPRERAEVTPLRRVRAPRSPDATGVSVQGEGAGEPTSGAAGLSSVEEQAFITRAVTFLSGREHADIILGRVWEQLVELSPEGFYEPPSDAAPDAAGGDQSEAGDAGAASPPPSEEAP